MAFYKISSSNDDTATDGYRRATCDELPPKWELVSGTLPVVQGYKVGVRCREGGLVGKEGTVLCKMPGVLDKDTSCPIGEFRGHVTRVSVRTRVHTLQPV